MPSTMNPAGKPIVVIGSINMDLVCATGRIPRPGETVIGGDLRTIPGGKGANQAVAAARLGGNVHFVGRVGSDDYGKKLLDGLRSNGVNTDHVGITPDTASGCALILVDKKGQNSIVVSPGANHKVTPADVDAAAELIRSAAAVVMQLEIPLDTVQYAIKLCRRLGVFTILDPAPVPPRGLSAGMFNVDIISPNESETDALLGRKPTENADPEQSGNDLLARGARTAVLKLGARGAMIVGSDGQARAVPPFKVEPTDTTAAGDAFTGALAVGLAEGMSLAAATRLANATGALCCTTFGAQPSLPTRNAVNDFLAAQP
jgi:ribokinase